MYVNLAKKDKEIARMKKREEIAKGKIVEAQEAIREKNAIVLQKAVLASEVKELRERLVASERAYTEEKRKKVEKIVAARAEESRHIEHLICFIATS